MVKKDALRLQKGDDVLMKTGKVHTLTSFPTTLNSNEIIFNSINHKGAAEVISSKAIKSKYVKNTIGNQIIVIQASIKVYVLIAPRTANIRILKEEYFKDLIATKETVESFVKWLVSNHGFARQDEGCDFEYINMPTYSLD